jgi:hypothetical protein
MVVVVEKTVTVVITVVTTMVITVVTTTAVMAMAVVPMVTEVMAHHMAEYLLMAHHAQRLLHQLHQPSKKQVSSDWQPVIVAGCQSLDLEV